MKHKAINVIIMMFDTNDIHTACDNLGHSTDWEQFDKELDSYTLEDSYALLRELVNILGEEEIQ